MDVVVKWVEGVNGVKTPIVSYPPSHASAAKAGTPFVGPVVMGPDGKLAPAGGSGAVATPAPAQNLNSAVQDVLKVITSKLDNADLRESQGSQKAQDAAIAGVNKRLSTLEKSTRDLIATTTKQTNTLKGMLGYDEFQSAPNASATGAAGHAAPAPAPAPAAPAPAPTPAVAKAGAEALAAGIDSAASKIAGLKAAVAALQHKSK